jgi:hypothetical protein
MRSLLLLFPLLTSAATVPIDLSAVAPGPVKVESGAGTAIVRWPDAAGREWHAEFSLDPAKPLIQAIGLAGKNVVERAIPIYRCETGKRRGGWDAFFDFPPSHPEGTRAFMSTFKFTQAKAKTVGDRVEISFDGLQMGIFQGGITYTFYPGSRLIQQEAVVSTNESDVAYFYDAGLRIAVDADVRPGGNMESAISYYDAEDHLEVAHPNSSEWHPVAVKYRTLAAKTGGGSIAVFPAPHRYLFARDYTTNMGYLWHTAWRGNVSIGIRELHDDNSPFYPWMNAPPGTEQHLGLFLLVDDGDSKAALDGVLRYTHRDHFPRVDGFQTFAPHWHYAYTVQAMANGFDWTPPFKPVLKNMGVDSAMIMDFHGDGHPADPGELRLKELDAYYRACKAQSDKDFLLIPAEEANTYLGGHWALVFPKPVYWRMKRPEGVAFQATDAKYGTVYNVGNAKEMLDLVRAEHGFVYQTHPRTKGSTGFPDEIRNTKHFLDQRYLGAGWKAMPSDLSSPRLGERSLKLLDDMSNWGLHKIIMGEVDVFQIDHTHELYSAMNVNYVRAPRLPDFDNYGSLLNTVAKGDFFTTTGEIMMPKWSITAGGNGEIIATATIRYTFPLKIAEVVWGDGAETHRQLFPLERTREFGEKAFEFKVDAKNWKWARLAFWDVAADGVFVNPTWR